MVSLACSLSGSAISTPPISAPIRPATGWTVTLPILWYLLEGGVVTGGFGLAEERGDAELGGPGTRADHEGDDVLQGGLHGGADRDVVGGAARRQDQLRHRRGLVLDVDVVVGHPLALVGLRPVLRLDDALTEIGYRGELGRIAQRGGRAEQVVVAGRGNRVL